MEAGGGGVGKRLLDDIDSQKETLSSLLVDVRLTAQHHNNTSGALHVPLIDSLLRPHIQDHVYNYSVGGQFVQNNTPADSFAVPADVDSLPKDRPAIIEISSDKSCAGKTQLLYYLTGVALLPAAWNGINLGGKDGAVIFIDCDGGFDILRLANIVVSFVEDKLSKAMHFCQTEREARNIVTEETGINPEAGYNELDEYISLLSSITPADLEELAEYALTHLHLYQPQTPAEFLNIIQEIPSYLTSAPTHVSHDLPLATLVVDGISSFYWLERNSLSKANIELTEDNAIPETVDQLTLQSRYEIITSRLLTISERFGANIIITNIVIPSANAESSTNPTAKSTTPQYPRHLPFCYTYSPKFLSARIILAKDAVAPFHADINLKEAWEERHMRMEVVRKAGVSAWIEGAGIRQGELKSMKAEGGWFWFRISEDGVQIGLDEDDS